MFTRVVVAGLVLGVASGSLHMRLQAQSETAMPMYERQAADQEACSTAEAAIGARLAPSRTAFAGACKPPSVTRLWNRPGFVVVTQAVNEPDAPADARRRTFSVLLDGRHTDGWRIVDLRQAPNMVTVDTSMLPLHGRESSHEANARLR